jgi:hypothetical protein
MTFTAAQMSEYRRNRTYRQEAIPAHDHGKRSTYQNWGCRCQRCKDANAAYIYRWRGQSETP